MFNTLLIANRGEIACRIARTARRMGLRTVAVYSDADREALHVALCDTAVRIGAPEAARSYLDAAAIVAAARAAGAQAIHPGYGFLSESLALIDACEAAGLIFVGPSRDAIQRMGSKIESKRIALEAGVPVVPGYHADDQNPAVLQAAADGIGYPVLIKASAGGGGKGMRVVRSAAEFVAALETVRREALASFGDDRVLLERYLDEPRHLEVQLLGDKHGTLVHLFERECSIQRNHQKVMEEAPAPHLPPAVREALFAHALTMGRAIGYDSTGTIEFIHDSRSGDTFFLEMNTRLQVEHPVTE
jgi:3-methylcrotonyl-CoA carboxylase alpha subunit